MKSKTLEILNFIERYKIQFNTKPSFQTISSATKTKVRSVKKAIRELEKEYFGEKYEQKKQKPKKRNKATKTR